MNKRVQELVIATDAWCDQNLPSNWTDRVDEYLPVWNEKFAESLIQECISVVNQRYMGDNNREDFEVRRCVEDLKKHFGVE